MAVMEGYKQTEVGLIPEDWEVSNLGSLIGSLDAGVSVNSVEKDKHIFAHDESILKTSCVFGGNFLPEEHKQILPRDIHRAKLNPRKDSIIFSRMNTPALVGECGYVERDYPTLFMPDRLWMTRLDGTYSPCARWLAYLLSFGSFNRAIKDTATGTSGSMKNISKGSLLSVPVPLPTKAEQEAIAGALSDADALIEALEQLIAKKRDLKQAAMQQLLTGQTRLPGFSGEWGVKRLGEVATFHKGKGLPKSALSPFGAEPCIHYGELFTYYPETISEIISRTDTTVGTFRSVANDVLMPTSDVTPRGLAKASCVRTDGVILGGDILVIRSDTKLIFGSFLSYLIRYEEDQVLQLVTGSTVFHLYGSDMKKFVFSMPSLPEQTAIATVLSDMDTEIDALEARRDKTRALKQGMMQELLTGRIRLV
jgi:type I restriction enzyme S subunit